MANGINTVNLNGEVKHITELGKVRISRSCLPKLTR